MRKAALPPTPNDYKAELPADFKLPPGIEFKFEDGDPLLAQARQVMHDVDQGKLSGQQAFSKFLGIYAGARAGEAEMIKNAYAAEIAKIGPAGPAQVTAIHQWLDSVGAPGLKARVLTAQDVKEFNNVVSKFISQGAAPFSQAHRVPGETGGKVSDEEFAKMGPAQRLDYARQFDQSQFQKAG